ncbi:hypothetical protein [Arthrobacter sp. Rue61a]|uniref:hypothetical protein n=1 Tax=Arthrobacter sp. Rue61a TaxID=1118963 RepID=UPI00027DFE34|nr:hypothetical protein [Arthrobacter sp. Rue61a]AFR28799.1 hypothetical protein ARUE_c18930 [Arthrobacter sp. Rue61a]
MERQVPRFSILAVFDIGQRDLIDRADDISTVTAQLSGAENFGIIGALTCYLEEKVLDRPIAAPGRREERLYQP